MVSRAGVPVSRYKPWPPRVDWFRVVVEARNGATLSALSSDLGIPKSTLSMIITSDRNIVPLWSNAERLIQVWMQVTGRGFDELPRVRR